MKGAGKIIVGISVAAVFLLLYVHEQISLFHISYLLDARAENLSRMGEEYRELKFEVEQLKAPRLLEEKMKELSLNLTLPQEVEVVKVPDLPKISSAISHTSHGPLSDKVLDFFGRWVDVAQAKTDN